MINSKAGLNSDGMIGSPLVDFKRQIHSVRIRERLRSKPEWQKPTFPLLSRDTHDIFDNICRIDWLRCTLNGRENLWLLDDLFDLMRASLSDLDLIFVESDRQMLGYPTVYYIKVWQDNQLVGLGFIGVCDDFSASHVGLCLDLTGVACAYLQRDSLVWFNFVKWLAGYKARITRADVAFDMQGSFCKINQITVPLIASDAYNQHIFAASYTRNKSNCTYNHYGDWSVMLHGGLAKQDYDPSKHCSGGLTFNVGARSSPRYWRIYEKGKQLKGLLRDVDYVSSSNDDWWIRIECEFKRDKDGSPIPYELLLEPDLWIFKDRPMAGALLDQYRHFLNKNEAVRYVHQNKNKKEKTLLLSKKIVWARRQCGRLVTTLMKLGFTSDDVCDSLLKDKGLKDFIYDLSADDYFQFRSDSC